jgi:hypothetical protein
MSYSYMEMQDQLATSSPFDFWKEIE